jgi:hypothetical protein
MTIDIFGEYDVPIYPDIAVNTDGTSNDMTDPVSSQPNVSTPSAPTALNGWPGNGIPIFSDFNKLFRQITQWIRYFYNKEAVISGTIPGTGVYQYNIALPSGFTIDNCVLVACKLKISSTWINLYYQASALVVTTDLSGTSVHLESVVGTGGGPYDIGGHDFVAMVRKIA